MPNENTFQREFFHQLACPWELGQLFDYLPDTCLYAKNLRGQFVMVNQTLVELLGLENPDEIIGKTDYDFSSRERADRYIAEDARVVRSAKPLTDQAWLIPDSKGLLKWYFSSKIPLFGEKGEVIGIAGVMRDVEKAGTLLGPYREMGEALSYVIRNYGEKVDVKHLARLVHLSVSQFDRRFKRLFQMPPKQFILSVRINAACQLLTATRSPIGSIALRAGFYDQSHFTRLFKRSMGVTPTDYRRKYQTSQPSSISDLS